MLVILDYQETQYEPQGEIKHDRPLEQLVRPSRRDPHEIVSLFNDYVVRYPQLLFFAFQRVQLFL